MMEPNLLKKNRTNYSIQNKYLIIAVFMIVTLFMGSSYALLTNFDNSGWEVLSFKDNDLNLTLRSSNPIVLNDKFIQSDAEGLRNNPITLTFTNTDAILGDSKNLNIKKYEIKLISKENSNSNIDYSYIKYAVSFNNVKYNVTGNLSESNNVIYTDYNLQAGKSKTIYLKLWLDKDKITNESEILGKEFYGAIDVKMYSDAEVPAASELISTVDKNGLVAVNMNGYLYENGNYIREYRYAGSNVNNYITFNNETWRIVGLFDIDGNGKHNIKIVKDTPLASAPINYTNKLNNTYVIQESVDNSSDTPFSKIYWNNSKTGNSTNDWSESGLMYYLNEESSINHNSYYDMIDDRYKSFIDDTTYYLGSVNNESKVNIAYIEERNNDSKISKDDVKTWVGKIGLLYPSDYGYATLDSAWAEHNLANYNEIERINKVNWLLNSNINGWNWLISPSKNSSNEVLNYSSNGTVNNNGNVKDHANAVRPVLNLKEDILFTSGDGTINNPYQLISK